MLPLAQRSSLGTDNGNVHWAAANIIVSKSRAARGSVCNVLLSVACREVGLRFPVSYPCPRVKRCPRDKQPLSNSQPSLPTKYRSISPLWDRASPQQVDSSLRSGSTKGVAPLRRPHRVVLKCWRRTKRWRRRKGLSDTTAQKGVKVYPDAVSTRASSADIVRVNLPEQAVKSLPSLTGRLNKNWPFHKPFGD